MTTPRSTEGGTPVPREELFRALRSVEPPPGAKARGLAELSLELEPARRRRRAFVPLLVLLGILVAGTSLAAVGVQAWRASRMREERVEPVGQGVTNAARPQPSRPAAPEVSARSSSENTAAFAEVVGPEPAPEKEIVPRHAGSSISRGSPSVPSARGADGEGADSLSEQVATYRRALGMPNREAALGEWREMLKRWPSTTLRHEIELNIVDALARLGRREEARGAASTFLKHFPSSPRAGDMKKLLAGDTPKH